MDAVTRRFSDLAGYAALTRPTRATTPSATASARPPAAPPRPPWRIKTEAGTTTNYLYDGGSIHAEYGTNWASPTAVHVMAGTDFPLARLTGATALPAAYYQDGLGSVLATVT